MSRKPILRLILVPALTLLSGATSLRAAVNPADLARDRSHPNIYSPWESGFGSYGDILVRDRKMYVAPTPFALAEGTPAYSGGNYSGGRRRNGAVSFRLQHRLGPSGGGSYRLR